MNAFRDLLAWLLGWKSSGLVRPPAPYRAAAAQAFVAGGDAQQVFVN
jgi:hypothetical protein